MPRISAQKAAQKVGGRYNLVLIASIRARELSKGGISKVKINAGPTVTALTEIEQGHVGLEYLAKIRDVFPKK